MTTLTEFCHEVNELSRAHCARLNERYRRGELLFGAQHHELPESMLRLYYDRGASPRDAYEAIIAEGGQ